MKHITRLSCLLTASLLLFSSCSEPDLSSEEHALKVIAQHPADSFEYFVTQKNYPVSPLIYFNDKLLRQASSKSVIYICLSQQRARLYVKGAVAADWPVSTGAGDRATPTGSYRIIEKKADHASTLWGRLYDADGKVINRDANSTKITIPEGGKFVGSAMPYWQRLTWDGIGMHIGRVVPGRKLSHGCIRMPRKAAAKMFDLTTLNRTRVHIVDSVEAEFPRNAHTAMHAHKIVSNYRKYAADYAKQHGADEDVEMTEVFLLSQKNLASQLPAVSNFEHIELREDALNTPELHPSAAMNVKLEPVENKSSKSSSGSARIIHRS